MPETLFEEDGLHAFCIGCAYSLRGLHQPRCPECGRGFDPQVAATYDTTPHRRKSFRLLVATVAVALVAVIFHLGAWMWLKVLRYRRFDDFTQWELLSATWVYFGLLAICWGLRRHRPSLVVLLIGTVLIFAAEVAAVGAVAMTNQMSSIKYYWYGASVANLICSETA